MSRASAGVIVLAVVFFAAHAPFLPSSLEDVDSINFALGIRDYDVAQHQPHPPGYPVYLAAAKALNVWIGAEPRTLALLSAVSGAVAVWALFALFQALMAHADRGSPFGHPHAGRDSVPAAATILAVTAPLFWFTAARPLSDVPGLAAAVAVQAMLLRAGRWRGVAVAAFAGGLAAGIRSQVVWLTAPLLFLQILRRPAGDRWRGFIAGTSAYALGGLLWFVPLVAVSGGPAAYWTALIDQGAEDFGGVVMLWTHPSPRLLAESLLATYLTPWNFVALGLVLFACAVWGGVRLLLDAGGRRILLTLVAAYGPYHAFNLLFQEIATIRYVLPMVVPMAFLAAAGLRTLSPRAPVVASLVVAMVSALTTGRALAAYARDDAPAFRALDDLTRSASPDAVFAMHRRASFDLRRPLRWMGPRAPRFDRQLPSPPKHEWLELVRYWNEGGRAAIWFVADPLRSDLALIRHGVPRRYEWSFEERPFLGGVRPGEMHVYRLDPPDWYLGEGWAVTPESAGVAQEDRRGPGIAPIQGWIRRSSGPAILMIGGRNLTGPEARVQVNLDDRALEAIAVPPGFFLRFIPLPAGALTGTGDYIRVEVSASSPQVAIEQFDSQPQDRLVFGFGNGWYEHEYDPSTGRQWRWMSDRAELDVRSPPQALTLRLAGEIEAADRSRVAVRIGGRTLLEQEVASPFALSVAIPADALAGAASSIELTSSAWYVPAEQRQLWRRSADPRRLGLKMYQVALEGAAAVTTP